MKTNEAFELDYGIAMSVKTLVTALGMQAENEKEKQLGRKIPFGLAQFHALLNENGLDHNAIVSRWYPQTRS